MFDHLVAKVICWVFAAITLFGGINYFYIAQNKDLVPKVSSSTNGRKAVYYLIGLATIALFVCKLIHHQQHTSTSYYY